MHQIHVSWGTRLHYRLPQLQNNDVFRLPFNWGEYLKSIIWILSSTRPAVTLAIANSSWVISIYFSLTRFSQLRWPNILFIYVRSFLKGTKINLVTLYKNFFNLHLAIYNFSNIVNVDEIDLTFGLVPWAKLEETKTKEFWILSWFKIFPLNNFIFYPSLESMSLSHKIILLEDIWTIHFPFSPYFGQFTFSTNCIALPLQLHASHLLL